ncbi:MAG: zf-TFIIB domain-containing protein [Candidatus Omnitrophica bacterium]|nr:zf-TFIIB domain-containing protein [Candidatus Omnitrophota bacterium]
MNCPGCSRALRQVSYEGILIDTCDGCGGEWLDAGEILKINKARETVFAENEKSKVEGAQKVVLKQVAKNQKSLSCPRCKVPLQTLNYMYDTGVMIDKCSKCSGIWMDNNELEAIQIVVEEWEKRDPEIRARFSPILKKIQCQTSVSMEQDAGTGAKGFLKRAMVYNMF